ncbi:MAG: penicillin-binding protein activator [Hyphomicrobiaceae bacterium]
MATGEITGPLIDVRRLSFSSGPVRLAVAAGLLASAHVLSGCATGTNSVASQLANPAPSAQQGPVSPAQRNVKARVAMLLPLTARGHPAVVAKGLKQAGEMALFEHKSKGFRLLIKDTRGTPEGAAAAATKALSEGAELIIGPLFAKSVTAAARVAGKANIPLVAFSNDRRVAGRGTYLLSFQANEEVQRIVSFAAANGHQRFTALIPDNAYGNIVEPAFRAAVSANGGTVVALKRYPASTGGVLEPSRELFEEIKGITEIGGQVDALFVPGGPEILSNLAPVIANAQLDLGQIKLLGSGGWDYPNISRERAFVGGWYPSPDPRSWRTFSEKYSKTYGGAPPRIASLAYDAVTIAIRLGAAGPKGARYSAANLTRSNGFLGVDGAVRFKPGGTAERGLAVVEVQTYGPRIVSPAPSTFSAPQAKQASGTFSFGFN